MYKIVIDGSLCSGFGDCADAAPVGRPGACCPTGAFRPYGTTSSDRSDRSTTSGSCSFSSAVSGSQTRCW